MTALALLLALYSPDAGFPRGEVVRVWQPDGWTLRLDAAVRDWNEVAGVRIFRVAEEKTTADVTLHDPTGEADGYPEGIYAVPIGADGLFVLDEPYVRCEVWITLRGSSPTETRYLEHELGHCLGFDHRAVGVMADGNVFDATDREMLQRAGYAA